MGASLSACSALAQAIVADGWIQTVDETESGLREVSYESLKRGPQFTRSLSCDGEEVIADVEKAEFESEAAARRHYEVLIIRAASECPIDLVVFDDLPPPSLPPPTQPSSDLSKGGMQATGFDSLSLAGCLDGRTMRSMRFYRWSSRGSLSKNSTSWIIEDDRQAVP
jgi:hypothetical protein